MAERRGRLTYADTGRALALLTSLPVEVREIEADQLQRVVSLAREHQLFSYDAAYLATAIYGGCPLATLDKRLRDAANVAGVKVF